MKLKRKALKVKGGESLLNLAKNQAQSLVRYGKVIWNDEVYKYEPYFEDDAQQRSAELYQVRVYYNNLTPFQAQRLVEESYNNTWLKEFGIKYPIEDYDERPFEERSLDFVCKA